MATNAINYPALLQGGGNMFFLIAGPCVIENAENPFIIAERINTICKQLGIPYIFKGSYRKANRSKGTSFKGIGDRGALEILAAVGKAQNVPVTTDIHSAAEAELAAEYADILQIPAFLCRQTDILEAAAGTGRTVNVKKGQFLNAEAMGNVVQKLESFNTEKIMLTERGTTFGYNDLVVDYRSIPIMQGFNKPVVMDCTHALQQPNQPSGVTGGQPEYIPAIAKAAVAVGADGLFIETHPEPEKALSDGANMLKLENMEQLLRQLVKIRQAIAS